VGIDEFQIEETGAPAVFKVTTPNDTRYRIKEIRISLADDITGITTVAGATENATVNNLDYSTFMGVAALTYGIGFAIVEKGVTQSSGTLRDLGDFFTIGFDIKNHVSNGTKTFVTLLAKFDEPILLVGAPDSYLSFTINDNLSSLQEFIAITRGPIEV